MAKWINKIYRDEIIYSIPAMQFTFERRIFTWKFTYTISPRTIFVVKTVNGTEFTKKKNLFLPLKCSALAAWLTRWYYIHSRKNKYWSTRRIQNNHRRRLHFSHFKIDTDFEAIAGHGLYSRVEAIAFVRCESSHTAQLCECLFENEMKNIIK